MAKADPLNLNRALIVEAIAKAMPWYLDNLAAWMLNYESRRLEKMLERMCEAVQAFASFAMKPKWKSAMDSPGPGSISYSAMSSRAMKQASLLQMSMLQDQYAAHQSMLNGYQQQANLYGPNAFQQRRDLLNGVYGNILKGL